MKTMTPMNTDSDGLARTVVATVFKRGASCYLGGGFPTTCILEVTYEEKDDTGERDL